MARIEPIDIQTSLGASLGGVQTDVGAERVGLGLAQVGTALDRLGDQTNRAVAIVARGYNQRQAERVYLEGQTAYWGFESDLLRGKDGILLRRAEDFEGSTIEAQQRLTDFARDHASKMPVGPGRDAFLGFAAKEIMRTRDQVAGYEAENLEGLRVSRATAALSTRMQKTTVDSPERFLPVTRPDGTMSYADPELVEETERNLEMINRGWDDAQISATAKQLIAESAYKAVFAQVDLSPNRIPIAKKIQDAYESMWSPTERAAATKRLVDEGAYSSMDGIVAGSYSAVLASDSTPSEKALREHAASAFKAQFKAQNGYDAPDDMVQEVQRRASLDLRLRLDEDKTAHDDMRGAEQTEILKAVGRGDIVGASRLITKGLESASGEDDKTYAEWLVRMQGNLLDNRSGFAKETSGPGVEALLGSTEGKTRAEIIAMKPYMKESDFTSWAGPALGMKGTVPDSKTLGAALDAARVRVEGKGPYQKTPKADVNGVYAKKYQQMLDLSREYYDIHQKLPDKSELEEMATSLHLSADDSWHSGGFEGTLGELLTAPEDVTFNLAQSKDANLVAAALAVTKQNERLGRFVDERLGLEDRVGVGNVTMQELASDPALVAQILRFALLTNAPIEPRVEGLEPRQFRSTTADLAAKQNK